MKRNIIDKEIEQILWSGSKNEKIKTSPFFTTRVMGRIEQIEEPRSRFSTFSFVLKPALILIFIINIVNLYFFDGFAYKVDTQEDEIIEDVKNQYFYANSDFVYSDDLLNLNSQ